MQSTTMSSTSSRTTATSEEQDLDTIIQGLESFQEGSSVYGSTPSTKRGREKPTEKTSPSGASPPSKAQKEDEGPRYRTRKTAGSAQREKKQLKPKARKDTTLLPTTGKEPTAGEESDLVNNPPGGSAQSTSPTIEITPTASTSRFNQRSGKIIKAPLLSFNPHDLAKMSQYSVDRALLDYLLGKDVVPPEGYVQTMKLWYLDKWDHLHHPPTSLTNTMFLACIPPSVGNQERLQILSVATSNLAMARLSFRFWSKESGFCASDVNIPQHAQFRMHLPEQESGEPAIKGITDKFLTTIQELLETVRVLQKDIDRNAYLFRSVCVDTAQGLREGGDRMIREVKELTGIVASSTVPIGTPTKDKGTEAMPPPAPRKPSGAPATARKGPLTIKQKPKKQ